MSKYEHHFSHDEHHCVQLVPLFALLSESELAQVEQVVHHKTFEKGEAVISPFYGASTRNCGARYFEDISAF